MITSNFRASSKLGTTSFSSVLVLLLHVLLISADWLTVESLKIILKSAVKLLLLYFKNVSVLLLPLYFKNMSVLLTNLIIQILV